MELEESVYCLELLIEHAIVDSRKLVPLLQEADELISILVACVKNVKARKRR